MMRTVAAAALFLLGACGGNPKDELATKSDSNAAPAMARSTAEPAMAVVGKDIIETATEAGNFGALVQALTVAGLVETLKKTGPFTVLAPNNEAFAKIPPKDLEALLADKEQLTKVLKYHVIAGNVPSSQVATMKDVRTLEGGEVTMTVTDGKVVLNGNSTVTLADLQASNGAIHVINTVLMPPKR